MNQQWQTKASKEILSELMSKEGVYFGIEMDNELEQLRADIVEFELRPTKEIV